MSGNVAVDIVVYYARLQRALGFGILGKVTSATCSSGKASAQLPTHSACFVYASK